MKNTLSNWIVNAVYVGRGKKFTFKGRRWNAAMLDTQSPGGRLFKMSRQVGKSTIGSAESIARCCKFDNHNILYVAPTQDQARKYSQDKVKPMIEESPIIKPEIGRYNNVEEKEFVRGGKFYMKYARDNADRCRGITADMVHYDEVQDQSLELIEPVINEVLFTSDYKIKLYTGTPKSFSNPIEQKWQQSDQREWLVRCEHHSPAKWIKIGLRNIGKHGPICHHCGKLLDVDNGAWVRTNKAGKFAGFHVHQLHAKISHKTQAHWDEILDKVENYDEGLLLNEVFGESSDSASTPITEKMLREACIDGVVNSENPSTKFFNSKRYAGIDWGHGVFTTALTIGQWDGDKFRVIFMKAYEGEECKPEICIPDMAKIINRYRCERTHVDYGGGFGMWDDLDEQVRCPVTGMMWTSIKSASGNWKTEYENGNGDMVSYSIPMWSMNKTLTTSRFIKNLAKGNIRLLRAEDFFAPKFGRHELKSNNNDKTRSFSSHFLATRREEERDPKTREVKKTNFNRVGPDDSLQATIYAWAIAVADSRAF